MRPAGAVPRKQCGRRLPEGAGLDMHRNSLDPPLFIELDNEVDLAAAGPRLKLGAAVLPLQHLRLVEGRSQPQDLGRVEPLGHSPIYSLRHVVPPGPSSRTIPSALSSSR